MKHWFNTAVVGEKEDGVRYTVCTQMFYVDDGVTLADLGDVFKNSGIGVGEPAVRAYIAKNSVMMAGDRMRRPMAKAEKIGDILMGALAAGLGRNVQVDDVVAYAAHLKNVLLKNAVGAYLAERRKLYYEAGDGE